MTAKNKGKNPGEGAVEFAKQFVGEKTKQEALEVIVRLNKGELHDANDKRIKRCGWCSYFYKDKTRPNNSKVCGPSCKFAKDNHAKAVKKVDKALTTPKKSKAFERELYECHVYWIEYPFYLSEHYMLKRARRYESPCSPDKLEQIDAAIQRGYKRKNKATPTDGSDKVHIRGIRHGRSHSEVVTSVLEEDYFERKYSERHLNLERWRAQQFSRSKKV